MNQALNLIYAPRFIEEAVFLAQRDSYIAAEIQERRSRIYEISDLDERERLFSELSRSWFDRLGLGKVIGQCLQEHPLIGAHAERGFVVAATQAKEEGAELFVAPDEVKIGDGCRTLRLLLRPESLLDEEALRPFLRHELFHISDMLDPTFGYEPILPKAEGGPTYDTLITNRYRVLWDVTIAGRMARRGWCAATVRDQQLNDFHHAFPMLNGQCDELFNRFFDAAEPRHSELAAFAFDPRATTDSVSNRVLAGTHCSLCRFPTHAFESAPARLGAEVLAAIKEDFPEWTPVKGLCVQCADLYRGRQMSMEALRHLPGYISPPGE
ncbi:MAG TPA: hypothetical protein VK200_09100 [Candidatus Limnocylindrales bacterium]|nr:hypothetical protein [Candidatus Limnocylindrales bacterium]